MDRRDGNRDYLRARRRSVWGTSPVLVKRGLAHSSVSAATLYQQATILLTLLCAALIEGDLFAGKIAPLAVLIFCATGVVGAYLGRTLFVRSVDQIGASRAQSLNNSSPLITVLLTALCSGAVVGGFAPCHRLNLYLEGLVYAPASVVAPIWSAQPIVSFFSPRRRSRELKK